MFIWLIHWKKLLYKIDFFQIAGEYVLQAMGEKLVSESDQQIENFYFFFFW